MTNAIRHVQFQSTYGPIISDIKDKFNRAGCIGVPDFKVKNMKCVRKWINGTSNTSQFLRHIDRISLTQASRDKIIKPIRDYIKKQNNKELLEEIIRYDITEIEKTCIHSYIKYLQNLVEHARRCQMIDKDQIAVMHGMEYPSKQLIIRNQTLNQSIRYIKYHFINDITRFWTQDGIIIYERKNRSNSYVDWWAAPEPYINKIREIYSIHRAVISLKSDQEKFYEKVKIALAQ